MFGVEHDYYEDYCSAKAEVKDLKKRLEASLSGQEVGNQYTKILHKENETLRKQLKLDDLDIMDFFSSIQKEIHKNSKEKGWWDLFDNGTAKQKNPLEIYALIHAEISEAVEEARNGTPPIYQQGDGIIVVLHDGPSWTNRKPEGQAIELADAIIRALDYAESMGWNLGEAIHLKMQYNKTREYRHGNKVY